jgi:Flp pilus assembly pilin Flp
MKALMSFWKDEDGLTSVEYALLLALVAIAAIGAWQLLGTKIEEKVNDTATDFLD